MKKIIPSVKFEASRRAFLVRTVAFGGALLLGSLPAAQARPKPGTAKGRPDLELVKLPHLMNWIGRLNEYSTGETYDGRRYSASIKIPIEGRPGSFFAASAVINDSSGARDSISVVYPDQV